MTEKKKESVYTLKDPSSDTYRVLVDVPLKLPSSIRPNIVAMEDPQLPCFFLQHQTSHQIFLLFVSEYLIDDGISNPFRCEVYLLPLSDLTGFPS